MKQIHQFDTFKYSLAVLFVIFMLMLFIGILWYNTLHREFTIDNTGKQSQTSTGNNNNRLRCIPKPPEILNDSKFY